MRMANLDGRAVLMGSDGTVTDVASASDGRFGPDPAQLFAEWDGFAAWARTAAIDKVDKGKPEEKVSPQRLGPPSPSPRQIVAFGLNYADHAGESGFDAPTGLPPVFPKFVSSLAGPVTTVTLPEGGSTDWEIELVVIIGRPTDGASVAEADAWDYVAGLTIGQDISDRTTQFSTPAPQFGLGKSFPGFSPTGPWLVTPDELPDRDDLQLRCTLDGEVMQEGRTSQLIYPVPRLIAGLSGVISLYAGDVIFTGTPSGVGIGRDPKVFIQPDQELVSTIDGLGELRQRFVASGQDGSPTVHALMPNV